MARAATRSLSWRGESFVHTNRTFRYENPNALSTRIPSGIIESTHHSAQRAIGATC